RGKRDHASFDYDLSGVKIAREDAQTGSVSAYYTVVNCGLMSLANLQSDIVALKPNLLQCDFRTEAKLVVWCVETIRIDADVPVSYRRILDVDRAGIRSQWVAIGDCYAECFEGEPLRAFKNAVLDVKRSGALKRDAGIDGASFRIDLEPSEAYARSVRRNINADTSRRHVNSRVDPFRSFDRYVSIYRNRTVLR